MKKCTGGGIRKGKDTTRVLFFFFCLCASVCVCVFLILSRVQFAADDVDGCIQYRGLFNRSGSRNRSMSP